MFTKGNEPIGRGLAYIGLSVFTAVCLVHLFLLTMNVQAAAKPFPAFTAKAQTFMSAAPEWSSDCASQKTVIAGIGLGDAQQLINPQTLAWPFAGDIISMRAQVAGVVTNEPLPDGVNLTTNATEQVTVTESVTNGVAYYFSAPLLPATVVTSTVFFPEEGRELGAIQLPAPDSGLPPKGSGPRALVLFAQVAQSELWRSLGRLTLASVAPQRDVTDSVQEFVTFPSLESETDLIVTAVSIDNGLDDRAIHLEAAAGGVSTTVVETGPTHGDILNITTLTLTAVPSGTNQLTLTMHSPPSPVGDAATLIGFNLNYQCKDVSTDPKENHIYLPIIHKPAAVRIEVTHSQNPAIYNIPYHYFITVTNESNIVLPHLVIKDLFPAELKIEAILPPDGCVGYTDVSEYMDISPDYNDLSILCHYEELAPAESISLKVRVRPVLTPPTTIEPAVNVFSLVEGIKLDNKHSSTPTQIINCLANKPGEYYSPLLIGETYCGQVIDERDAAYYFTFTLEQPGHVTAVLTPAKIFLEGLDPPPPAAVQLAFRNDSNTANLTYCCSGRKQAVIIEYTYLDAGDKLLAITSRELYGFTYTLRLDYEPIFNFEESSEKSEGGLAGGNEVRKSLAGRSRLPGW